MSRVMAGDTSFARGGVGHHLAALVHRDAWIVVDRDERMATTRLGSTPGHTLADLAFNFVMLDALKEVAGRLRDEGLIESVEWYPEFGAPCGQLERLEVLPVAFMDDIHAFSSHGRPKQAVRTCTDCWAVLTSLGVIRFAGYLKPGKTEALLALRGKSSLGCSRPSQARRRSDVLSARRHPGAWFAYCDSLQTPRGDVSKIFLDAPGEYLTGQCWHSRVQPLARTVIGNQGIERSTRQALARSLIFSVLLSGAGTWPQLTAASARRIRAVFMRVQRMLLGELPWYGSCNV